MGRLPELPYGDSRTRAVQRSFGGYCHTESDFDGTIYHMENLSSDYAPLLSSRRPRSKLRTFTKCNGIYYVNDSLISADGTTLRKDDRIVGAVTDSPKVFAVLGDRLIIYPDKVYLNYAALGVFSELSALSLGVENPSYGDIYAVGTAAPYTLYYWDGSRWTEHEKEFGGLEDGVTTIATFLGESTLYGEKAAQNAITGLNAFWGNHFSVGDAVTISGCTRHPENNVTAIIREIDGQTIRFYEYLFATDTVFRYELAEELAAGSYSFAADGETRGFSVAKALPRGDVLEWNGTTLTAQSGTPLTLTENAEGTELVFTEKAVDTAEPSPITIRRSLPELEFLFSVNNRLWGCGGDTIYCSKLGDPFNFNVFDGISTDSWTVNSGSPGNFTAGCAYLGYPLFFKEDRIYKVYGSRPAEFSLTDSMTTGVAKGSGSSLAVAGETLIYLSPRGPVAYRGGVPDGLWEAFGDLRLANAVAAARGNKYYIAAADDEGNRHIFVYDTACGLWHREDELPAVAMAGGRNGVLMATATALWCSEALPGAEREEEVRWFAEFGPFIQNSPEEKTIIRLKLRLIMDEGAAAAVDIAYDGGSYQTIGRVRAEKKMRTVLLPLIPRRCDHFRLRVSGGGGGCCKVASIAVEYEV